jgi:hypothetical protein
MPRFPIPGQRSLIGPVILGFIGSVALSGCDSRSASPIDQATVSQAAAKSSMDFTRKQLADKKIGSKSKAKGH